MTGGSTCITILFFFFFVLLSRLLRLPRLFAPLTLILGGVELAAEAVSCLSGVNRGLLELLLFSFTQLRRRSHQLLAEIERSEIQIHARPHTA